METSIPKIKSFLDMDKWKVIDFPSHKKDWKKIELNNKSFVLSILFVPYNTKERHAYKSKYNFKCEN